MATRKPQTVILEVKEYGMQKAFDLKHAERLLAMGEANGGWALQENSRYTYDRQNGLRRKSDKADTAETK